MPCCRQFVEPCECVCVESHADLHMLSLYPTVSHVSQCIPPTVSHCIPRIPVGYSLASSLPLVL